MIKLSKPSVAFLKRDLYPNHFKGKEIEFDRIRNSNTKSRLEVGVINLGRKRKYIDSGFLTNYKEK